MNLEKLVKSDLNLLVIFQILMEERSVSKAAQRMHLTQPAVSKTLKRLRDQFNDPLFTRTSHGLAPSAKALALYQQLPNILSEVDRFLNVDPFNPLEYRGAVKVACSDLFSFYLPHLVDTLLKQAPAIKLESAVIPGSFMNQLNDGSLDFALHPPVSALRGGIVSTPVVQGKISCVVRKDHPLATQSRLSLDDYLQYPSVRPVIPNYPQRGSGQVDAVLAALGERRSIIFETPFLSAALKTVQMTDAILTFSDARNTADYSSYEFVMISAPREIEASSPTLNLYHHERIEYSAVHQWFREKIIDVIVSTASWANG